MAALSPSPSPGLPPRTTMTSHFVPGSRLPPFRHYGAPLHREDFGRRPVAPASPAAVFNIHVSTAVIPISPYRPPACLWADVETRDRRRNDGSYRSALKGYKRGCKINRGVWTKVHGHSCLSSCLCGVRTSMQNTIATTNYRAVK